MRRRRKPLVFGWCRQEIRARSEGHRRGGDAALREVGNRGSNFEVETGGKLRGTDLGTRVGGEVRSESWGLSVVVAVEFLVSCRPV